MADPNPEFDALSAPADAFRIALPNFEGPLDLLLHLIREHRLDILDIPISLITDKYLEHLKLMREINLDIAGEFLVMAATLLHLKSRMLLPKEEPKAEDLGPVEQGPDPRQELVRRLLEYQKYKDAADQLFGHDLLDRDVFPRRVQMTRLPLDPEEIGFQEISVFKLIEALDRVLKALEPKFQHEVVRDRLSLTSAIHKIADKLRKAEKVAFFDLFEGARTRSAVVITFIALLEMAKLKLIRLGMTENEEIWVSGKAEALTGFGEEATKELDREYQ
ncbi:MAG: segregation/condensation protein A [Myxococcaceae bacterium]